MTTNDLTRVQQYVFRVNEIHCSIPLGRVEASVSRNGLYGLVTFLINTAEPVSLSDLASRALDEACAEKWTPIK